MYFFVNVNHLITTSIVCMSQDILDSDYIFEFNAHIIKMSVWKRLYIILMKRYIENRLV